MNLKTAIQNGPLFKSYLPALFLVLTHFVLCMGGCSSDRVPQDQKTLHVEVHRFYENAILEIENEIRTSARLLEQGLRENTLTSPVKRPVNDLLSSLYIPLFSKQDHSRDQFFKYSQPLEIRWDQFLKKHPFMSWVYTFHVQSGALRIAPATPTELTFGKSMDFKQFEFYQSAVEHYPEVTWLNTTKEDMVGTGQVLIVSQGIRSSEGRTTHVVGADVKVSALARSLHPLFNEFVTRNRSQGFHFFSYLKPEHHFRSPISEYATDEAEWLSIKALTQSGHEFLDVSPEVQAKLLEVEKRATALADQSPSAQLSHVPLVTSSLSLAESVYRCSVSQIKKPRILLWICSK
jgi:hypothetical protein